MLGGQQPIREALRHQGHFKCIPEFQELLPSQKPIKLSEFNGKRNFHFKNKL